ncbi:hypothetical protein C0989_008387 [Termitomyces sp. Mn162]|nr:hypothetical protein C0989_008387 [Termitomyces sp. Mn162]
MILMSRASRLMEVGVRVAMAGSGVVTGLSGGAQCCWSGYHGPLYQFLGMLGEVHQVLSKGDWTELELKGSVKVIMAEIKLIADKDGGGTAVDEGGEDHWRAVELDVDDK